MLLDDQLLSNEKVVMNEARFGFCVDPMAVDGTAWQKDRRGLMRQSGWECEHRAVAA